MVRICLSAEREAEASMEDRLVDHHAEEGLVCLGLVAEGDLIVMTVGEAIGKVAHTTNQRAEVVR